MNKLNVALGLTAILLLVIWFGPDIMSGTSDANMKPVDGQVYKTAAHVTVNSDEYQLLFSDSENDVAYYRYAGSIPRVVIGDTITLANGSSSTVTNTDIYGFYTDGADDVSVGLSGTIVQNEDGETVGYVSSVVTGKLYCIWA